MYALPSEVITQILFHVSGKDTVSFACISSISNKIVNSKETLSFLSRTINSKTCKDIAHYRYLYSRYFLTLESRIYFVNLREKMVRSCKAGRIEENHIDKLRNKMVSGEGISLSRIYNSFFQEIVLRICIESMYEDFSHQEVYDKTEYFFSSRNTLRLAYKKGRYQDKFLEEYYAGISSYGKIRSGKLESLEDLDILHFKLAANKNKHCILFKLLQNIDRKHTYILPEQLVNLISYKSDVDTFSMILVTVMKYIPLNSIDNLVKKVISLSKHQFLDVIFKYLRPRIESNLLIEVLKYSVKHSIETDNYKCFTVCQNVIHESFQNNSIHSYIKYLINTKSPYSIGKYTKTLSMTN